MNVSPNILAKNQNFKKLRHGFVDERAMITGKPLYLFISLIQFLLSESFIWKLEKNASGFLQTMLIQHFKIFIFLLSYLQLIKLNMINQAEKIFGFWINFPSFLLAVFLVERTPLKDSLFRFTLPNFDTNTRQPDNLVQG